MSNYDPDEIVCRPGDPFHHVGLSNSKCPTCGQWAFLRMLDESDYAFRIRIRETIGRDLYKKK